MGQASIRDEADYHVGRYFRATGNGQCGIVHPAGSLDLMEMMQFLRMWSEDGVNEDVEE